MEAVMHKRKKPIPTEKRLAFYLGFNSLFQYWANSASKDRRNFSYLEIRMQMGSLVITFEDDCIDPKYIHESESLEDTYDLKVEALQHYWDTGVYIDPLPQNQNRYE